MPSCREIVSGALRKIGKLGAGREPRLADQTDVLAALQGLYRQLISQGTFGRLYDVIPTADYIAGENERVFRNSDAVTSISLPETVSSWGCGARPPADCSVVVIHDAFTGTTLDFIYDGNVKLWQPIDSLTLDTHAPLSHRNPEGLKSYLALQIVDEFGGTMGAPTLAQVGAFISSLTHRYDSPARGCGLTACSGWASFDYNFTDPGDLAAIVAG